jgi:hypothetical protein
MIVIFTGKVVNIRFFLNNTNGKKTTVPRHSEISDWLCIKICIQLDIPKIK